MESIRVKDRPTGAWRWLQMVLPLALAVVSACVVGAPGPARSTSQGDITRPELEQILSESAYQAVEQLRPSWLFYRRTPTISNPNPEPAVYVDQAKLLALDDLRSIPVQDVEQIRFLSSRDATTIYGTGHMWGAIVVTTRRPGGQA
ncbi:MAG: hypothetical protein OXN92_12800 [Gammaproteobacteria bacterium]|nr:hypothetical protein [Gammaproteobacteria bacterium]MDE0358594.1 hypothetical protein [Gammaproteobacteria bacterium]